MRAITLVCMIGSLIAMGLSAATSAWYVTVIWGLTASIWSFNAGVEKTNKFWMDEL